ncbi:MAG: zinc ABC transporter substrate-binding protein [Candidatus Gracilibacteria bacterium]|jgi:zinc transport system substrate-binding protein
MKKIIFLFVLLVACSSPVQDGQEDADSLKVSASFYPLAYFTQALVGEGVTVNTVVPVGVEPHDYEPTPQTLRILYDADLLVYQGSGFEPWMEGLESDLNENGVVLFSATAGIADANLDPHTWLDPILMSAMVSNLAMQLVEVSPEHEEQILSNATILETKLLALHDAFTSGLSSCKKNTILVSHNAFARLGERYHFIVESISGLSPHDEPSLNEMAALRDLILEKDLGFVFLETLASPETAEALAEEAGVATLVLNPLEGLTSEEVAQGEDYFSVMEQNLQNLRLALECD